MPEPDAAPRRSPCRRVALATLLLRAMLVGLWIVLALAPTGAAIALVGQPDGTIARAALIPAGPAATSARSFRCDGEPLRATLHGGAVDDPTSPNRSGGTLPGAFVALQWHDATGDVSLQLPRTNNAGAPSFTDGKWWWSLEDPEHPRFRLRRARGDIQDFACEPA